jgi:1-acyl-sn-glycerol-3-phosphate acyltransferase
MKKLNSSISNLGNWLATPFFAVVFLTTLVAIELMFRFAKFFKIPYNYERLYGLISSGTLAALKICSGLQLKIEGKLPTTSLPIVVISNHQGMFDIPFLNVGLKPLKLRFVAKNELARKIPAISIALREGEHAIIDRNQGSQAVLEIEKMAKDCAAKNLVIAMFPEGTRSKDGKLRSFKLGGMEKIVDTLGEVCFLPVAIKKSWHISRFGFKPIVYGVSVELEILDAVIATKDMPVEQYAEMIRSQIAAKAC